jgi:hypothetical protein
MMTAWDTDSQSMLLCGISECARLSVSLHHAAVSATSNSAAILCSDILASGSRTPSFRNPQPRMIVRRVREVLPRPQLSLSGLHTRVPQQQLDLLQFAPTRPAELR